MRTPARTPTQLRVALTRILVAARDPVAFAKDFGHDDGINAAQAFTLGGIQALAEDALKGSRMAAFARGIAARDALSKPAAAVRAARDAK